MIHQLHTQSCCLNSTDLTLEHEFIISMLYFEYCSFVVRLYNENYFVFGKNQISLKSYIVYLVIDRCMIHRQG